MFKMYGSTSLKRMCPQTCSTFHIFRSCCTYQPVVVLSWPTESVWKLWAWTTWLQPLVCDVQYYFEFHWPRSCFRMILGPNFTGTLELVGRAVRPLNVQLARPCERKDWWKAHSYVPFCYIREDCKGRVHYLTETLCFQHFQNFGEKRFRGSVCDMYNLPGNLSSITTTKWDSAALWVVQT